MNKKKTGFSHLVVAGGLAVLVLLGGCSKRSWYESFREIERQNCYELEDRSDRDKCLENVNARNYDQYQREREETLKNKEASKP